MKLLVPSKLDAQIRHQLRKTRKPVCFVEGEVGDKKELRRESTFGLDMTVKENDACI